MNVLINIVAVIVGFLSLKTGGKQAEQREKEEGVSIGKVLLIVVAFWYITKQFSKSQAEDLEETAPTDITVIQAQSIYKALHPYSNPSGVDGLNYQDLLQVADEVKKEDVAKVTSNYYTLYKVTLGGDVGKELSKNEQIEFYSRLNKTTTIQKVIFKAGDKIYARKDINVYDPDDSRVVYKTVKKGDKIGAYRGKYWQVKATKRVLLLIDLDYNIFSDGLVYQDEIYKI